MTPTERRTSDRRPLLAVSQGCTRLCLLVGPYAIKLPNVLRGWRDSLWGLIWNMDEVALAATRSLKLCPLICSLPGGLANVMRRARPMTADEFARFDHAAFLAGHEPPVPYQAKPCSFGFLPDGRVVCLDYSP